MLKQAAASHSAHGQLQPSSVQCPGHAYVFFSSCFIRPSRENQPTAEARVSTALNRPQPGPAARIRPSAETRLGSIWSKRILAVDLDPVALL